METVSASFGFIPRFRTPLFGRMSENFQQNYHQRGNNRDSPSSNSSSTRRSATYNGNKNVSNMRNSSPASSTNVASHNDDLSHLPSDVSVGSVVQCSIGNRSFKGEVMAFDQAVKAIIISKFSTSVNFLIGQIYSVITFGRKMPVVQSQVYYLNCLLCTMMCFHHAKPKYLNYRFDLTQVFLLKVLDVKCQPNVAVFRILITIGKFMALFNKTKIFCF